MVVQASWFATCQFNIRLDFRQYSFRQGLPIWSRAWALCIEMYSRCVENEGTFYDTGINAISGVTTVSLSKAHNQL